MGYCPEDSIMDAQEEARELQKEIARLRAALEKYGDEGNWTEVDDGYGDWGLMLNLKEQEDSDKKPWLLAQEALKDGT